MTSDKLDELAVGIDDAATVVEELQVDPNAGAEASEKLGELQNTLKNASDAIDEISEEERAK